LIVLVRNRTKAGRFRCFSAPIIVTRTRLIGTVTSALPLFFSNTQTQQLTHYLNIPHTHQQHAAVKHSIGWITWLLGNYSAVGITAVHTTTLQMLSDLNVKMTFART